MGSDATKLWDYLALSNIKHISGGLEHPAGPPRAMEGYGIAPPPPPTREAGLSALMAHVAIITCQAYLVTGCLEVLLTLTRFMGVLSPTPK